MFVSYGLFDSYVMVCILGTYLVYFLLFLIWVCFFQWSSLCCLGESDVAVVLVYLLLIRYCYLVVFCYIIEALVGGCGGLLGDR